MFINYKNRTGTAIPQTGPCAESSHPAIHVVRRGIGFMRPMIMFQVLVDPLYPKKGWIVCDPWYKYVRIRRIPFLKLVWDEDYVYLSRRSLDWKTWADQKIDISWNELRGSFSFQDQSSIDLLKIEILKKHRASQQLLLLLT